MDEGICYLLVEYVMKVDGVVFGVVLLFGDMVVVGSWFDKVMSVDFV